MVMKKGSSAALFWMRSTPSLNPEPIQYAVDMWDGDSLLSHRSVTRHCRMIGIF